jgi:hypothetical protein
MTPDTTQPFDVLHVLEHSQQLSYNELCSLNLGKISKKSQKFTYSNFPIFFYFLGMLQCNPIHYNIPKSYNNNNKKKNSLSSHTATLVLLLLCSTLPPSERERGQMETRERQPYALQSVFSPWGPVRHYSVFSNT